jgi:N-acetylmuramoyl-L-alanine amidase
MIIKKANILILSFCLLLIGGTVQADRVEDSYQRAAKKYHLLYKKTNFREKEHNWLNTIRQFELIYQKHPNHYRAPDSMYNIGKLYRSLFKWNGNDVFLDRSNIFLRKLIIRYPKSQLADEAQLLLAENYEYLKNDNNLAYLEYKKTIDNYPGTKVARKAQKKINTIKPPNKDLQLKVRENKKGIKVKEAFKGHYGGLSKSKSGKQTSSLMVSKVDYWSTSDWSRMVINIKGEIRYKYQGLPANRSKGKGPRIFIDIYNTFIAKNFKRRIAANDGLIKQARIAQFNKKTVRIVLDIASLKRINVYHAKLPHQYKIIVDIYGKDDVGISTLTTERERLKTPTKKSFKSVRPGKLSPGAKISLSQALGLKVKRIIIDPGHGGKDPGALGFGLKEKTIVLGIGKALRRLINRRHPQIRVMMTRDRDRFLSLEERTAFANKNRGDIFISIHVNASIYERIRGVETYFLNLTTDNEALALAAKENNSSLKSISELQGILNELMTNSKINESTKLATMVQNSIYAIVKNSTRIKTRNLGVKQAPFFVLLGAHMPSILIESGFITNRRESKLLRTNKYQKIVAEGIYRGIKKYMN